MTEQTFVITLEELGVFQEAIWAGCLKGGIKKAEIMGMKLISDLIERIPPDQG